LTKVFQEVPLTNGGTALVQFQYSNAVNGLRRRIRQQVAPHFTNVSRWAQILL
jgi:hypothetical protein